ncbi:MAG: ATP-binding protein [Anaerolineales bacterium]|uniref:ATP-binding protein n=1 Tax=Candidatus Desulfolinea nitratireducens TaxID=2841698 RepID=A0A8J6THC3_9CHLR|nr:ATP-binding protein [Candidatus Desulfolinea nitratireducens]MBL6960736.1 ATP-binding protein [Anaerolineales bacterium]
MNKNQPIGYLVGGGLKESFRVRLTVPSQEVQEGAFTVIRSGDWQYYGIVTDIQLGATDPRFADEQTEMRLPPALAQALHGQTLYTNLEVLPTLMLDRGPEPGTPEHANWQKAIKAGLRDEPRPRPVKNVPPHHAEVTLASEGDIAEIFGKVGEKGNFVIGSTREQDHPVCIDLSKFVQRSSGVFGATGTGKSFLTRIILAGLINYNAASVLVLDMHNEYGFDDTATDTNKTVPGLKTKFGSRVQVVGLGAGTNIRGANPDFHLEIAMSEIQSSDVLMLTRTLNLRETTPTVLDALVRTFGPREWFSTYKNMLNGATIEVEDERTGKINKVPAPESIAAWALENGVNVMAAEALHSKLGRLFNAPYISERPAADSVKQVIDNLDGGKHVILSFGKFDSDLDYLLVSNLLTRKISAVWEQRVNNFRTHGKEEPRHLILVVEEAHKLLNREMAAQTTFATIAREMRKYYVTLMIVDQRPSQIYDEVMSQLGTRISGWLGDDDDIRAVLSGLAGREALRGMLARLQPKEEVLLLGWGVPMPLPVKSRRYDERFWQELKGKKGKRSEAETLKELGF